MNTENFWKIQDITNKVTVLTYVPQEYGNGDGAYKVMKKLQKIFGTTMCSCQKFDERFDNINDFDTILRVNFNVWGERMIEAWLFEFDKENNSVTIDRQTSRKFVEDWEYTYSFRQTIIKAIGGLKGFKKHLLEWQNFSIGEYSHLKTHPIIELDYTGKDSNVSEFLSSGV